MAVGNIITAGEFNRVVGNVATTVERLALIVEDTNIILIGKTAEEWSTELNIPIEDINNAKSAMADMQQLIDIYQGQTNLATAKDFRLFVRRLRGLSSII